MTTCLSIRNRTIRALLCFAVSSSVLVSGCASVSNRGKQHVEVEIPNTKTIQFEIPPPDDTRTNEEPKTLDVAPSSQAPTPLPISDTPDIQPPPEPLSYQEMLRHQIMGIQLTSRWGVANVRSYLDRPNGERYEVANGRQQYGGYELSLSRPYSSQGISYSLKPRILKQSIVIADFRQSIPQSEVPGTTNIPVVVTEYETGLVVDPEDPNRYNIDLSALGVALEVKYNWVEAGNDATIFAEVVLGLSLFEYMTMEVGLGSGSEKQETMEFMHSYSIGVSGGKLAPKFHSAYGFGFFYLRYPRLDLSTPVEFRDAVRYNSDKQVFERGRVFLDEVEFDIFILQFSYTFMF
ncbi:MAG: hypothetical protein GY866_14435 [Proteobacteria bacterium]|nr:hypothetical protein [Pseudomonadota bacterium]